MTDRDLAVALVRATELEGLARAHWEACASGDLAERDPALVVVRKATELRIVLERWMAARTCRAALTTDTTEGVTHGGR